GESTVGSGTLRQRAVGEARTACLAADRAEVSTETASGSAAWRPALVDALGFDTHYGYLLHDRDSIFSRELDAAVGGFGLRILKTPPRCPMANGLCERVIGTIRRECLDWLIALSEAHLRRALRLWVEHYNRGRPHMMLGPGVPDPPAARPTATPKSCHRLGNVGSVRSGSPFGTRPSHTGVERFHPGKQWRTQVYSRI